MRVPDPLRDERGSTLPELMVGLGAGLVVFLGLSTLILVTLHTTTRVSARVDATQRARVAVTKVLDQLHSACIAPKIPPIRAGSTSTSLAFVHAPGDAVSPTPILTVISLSGTTLSQNDYAYAGGTAPLWAFDESKPALTRRLMTHVSPITPSTPVFSYYASSNGAVSATPLAQPLSTTSASQTIFVKVGLQVAPTGGPNTEAATPARIQGGATLRLTSASFNKSAPSSPCQ